jgi:hypothetical protein
VVYTDPPPVQWAIRELEELRARSAFWQEMHDGASIRRRTEAAGLLFALLSCVWRGDELPGRWAWFGHSAWALLDCADPHSQAGAIALQTSVWFGSLPG